jgi:hypothetical protein
MCCVLISERIVGKIREKGYEEEILQLYCRQLSFESCAIKTFSSTTAPEKDYNNVFTVIKNIMSFLVVIPSYVISFLLSGPEKFTKQRTFYCMLPMPNCHTIFDYCPTYNNRIKDDLALLSIFFSMDVVPTVSQSSLKSPLKSQHVS